MLERISNYTNSMAMITTTSDFPIYYRIPPKEYGDFSRIDKLQVQPSNSLPEERQKEHARKRNFYCNDTLLTFHAFLLPDNKHYLCIDITQKEIDDTTLEVLKQIFSVLALELTSMQIQNRAFSQKNYYDSFFYMLTDIKNKSIEEIRLVCDAYSFPIDLKKVCITLECQSKESKLFRSLYNAVNQRLIHLAHKYFLCHSENHIVIFLLYPKQTPNVEALSLANQIALQLSDYLKDYQTFFRLGISRCHTSCASIAKAYEESLQTLHLQTSDRQTASIHSYTRQFAFHLLNQLTSYEREKIYQDTVSILVIYDSENKGELLGTLKAYLENSLNLTETAQKLFIHRNTLTARLSSIKKLLCCDITSIEDIFRLYLGICAWELLKNT